ncbi:MAG: hypothetical protein IJ868_05310 [Prevotella sp.]|nr:hypothetical protein [Prevotella sp.]
MEYIDKSALIAEIERLKKATLQQKENSTFICADHLLRFINSLEVMNPEDCCKQPIIKGWVARDMGMPNVHFYGKCPKKEHGYYGGIPLLATKEELPFVKEDEPIEVELTIRKM